MLRKFDKSKQIDERDIPYSVFKDLFDTIQDGIWVYNVNENKYTSYSKNPRLSYLNRKDSPIDEIASNIHNDDRESTMILFNQFLTGNERKYESIYRVKNDRDEYVWIYSRGVKRLKNNIIKIYGSHLDITEKMNMQKTINDLAYYDLLTGLPNKEKINLEFLNVVNSHRVNFSFFLLEIDNFDYINNMFSYELGEELLKKLSNLLEKRYKKQFTSRVSESQFLIISFLNENEEIEKELEFLFSSINNIYLKNLDLTISVCCGVAVYKEENFKELFKHASIALYKAKSLGKNQYYLYNNQLIQSVYKMLDISHQIKNGIIKNQFELFYQPIISSKTDLLKGLEALIRWNHPKLGLIPPNEFVYIAEKYNEMKNLECWILNKAFQDLGDWVKAGELPLFISINLSAKGLIGDSLIPYLKYLLEQYEINPKKIEFEITESSVSENLDLTIKDMEILKSMGFRIALDDFGTGYSSLMYLKNLPINKVKLDKSFIKNIETSDKDKIFIKSIIDLSHSMELDIVAEGIENNSQKNLLIEYNCDFLQGYLYSKPQSVKDITIWIIENYIKKENLKKIR